MDSLEFIGIIMTGAVVIFWYVRNLNAGADGVRGPLGLTDDPEAAKPGGRRRSYRIKQRLARRAHEKRDADAMRATAAATPTFRTVSDAALMRRKFRRQDEARYRAKDKAARYLRKAERV